MDDSTQSYCDQIEHAFGREELKRITGSYAYTRFTASQIMKRFKLNSLNECIKICLISNFIPSLLCDKFCPVDYSDASGMNLMNLSTKKWDYNISDIIGLSNIGVVN